MMQDIKSTAVSLLAAMNTTTAHGRTDVKVEEPLYPEAERVALEYSSPSFNTTLRWLLNQGALAPDWETNADMTGVAGRPEYGWAFFITEDGFDLLQEEGYPRYP